MKEGLFALACIGILFTFLGGAIYQEKITIHKRLDLTNQAIAAGTPPLIAKCTYQEF